MGQHAVDLGYQRPGFVSTPRGHDIRADARLEGVREVFGTQRLAQVIAARPALNNAFATGFEGTLELLRDHQPDVIYYLNDSMAFGGLMACQKSGLAVPGDIGIVGFNALELTNVLPVRLTTLKTPRHLMGVTGARNFPARINGVTGERVVKLPVDALSGSTTCRKSGLARISERS